MNEEFATPEPTIVPGDPATDEPVGQVKQRFEANEAVQRWIRQTEEEEDDPAPATGRFLPAFLANHPDRAWILSSLQLLLPWHDHRRHRRRAAR